jgi:hypothetical protein
MSRLRFEREFFQLAGFALGCRLRVMGVPFSNAEIPADVPEWLHRLGETDHLGEMKLLCEEVMG